MSVPLRWGIGAVLLALIGNWVAWQFLWVRPARWNQSEFLRVYRPSDALRPFVAGCRGAGGHSSESSAAGVLSTRRSLSFHPELCAVPSEYEAVMTAVQQGALQAMAVAGARAISDQRTKGGGFIVTYRAGRSTGSLRAEPPSGMRYFGHSTLSIEVDETLSAK